MEENIFVDDFILDYEDHEYKTYKLKKDYTIFNKIIHKCDYLDGKLIIVFFDKNFELSKHISSINNYLKWLNSDDCKNKLISIFSKTYNEINHADYIEIKTLIKNKRYEELEVWGAKINIRQDGRYSCDIICNVGHHTKALMICTRNYDFGGFLDIEYKNL